MKKILYLALCLILVVAMTACFASCGKDTDDTTGTTGSTNDGSNSTNSTNSTDSTNGTNSTDSNNNSNDNTDNTPSHTHTYANEYSYDEENHFYAANCGHSDEKTGVEPHSFDEKGDCECGFFKIPEFATVEEAIAFALANNYKVNTGLVISNTTSKFFSSTTTVTAWYEINEKFTHSFILDDYVNNYYYGIDKNGDVFGIYIQGGFQAQPAEDAFEDALKGAKLQFFFMEDYESVAYGATNFVELLYAMAQEIAGEEAIEENIEDGVFTFSFTKNATDISVSFTLGEDGVLANATVTASNESCDYECTLEQVTHNDGINVFDPDRVKMDDYLITDAEGNDIAEEPIQVAAGETIMLYFTNVKPETALISLSQITITIVDEMGIEPWVWPAFDELTKSYSFEINTPGTYTMTITVDGVETEATIEVALKNPKTLASQVYSSAYDSYETVTSTNAYVNNTIYFKGFAGEEYNGAYTAEILGEIADSVAYISEEEINDEIVSGFTATVAGTYTIKLTSTVVDSISCTFTVTVMEIPDVEAMLTGYYVGKTVDGETIVTAKFVENTVEIESVDMSCVLSFTYADGEISFDIASGDDFIWDFYVNDSYELMMSVNGYDVVLQAAEEPKPFDPTAEATTGTISIKDNIDMGKNNGTYRYEIKEDGSIVIFLDGEETNAVIIQPALGGGYTMQCPGMAMGVLMNKISGEANLFSGKYSINFVQTNAYEVTITADVIDDDDDDVPGDDGDGDDNDDDNTGSGSGNQGGGQGGGNSDTELGDDEF